MNDSKTSNPAEGQGAGTLPKGPPLDEYTAAVLIAAFKAINSGYPFESLNRSNLFEAAYGLINFLVRTAKPDEPELIGKFAELNILLTKFLDHIVLNAPENDDRLRILRNMAKDEPFWPTMVRPGDRRFSDKKVEKLGVGTSSDIRRLAKDAKQPASFATGRNRLAFRLLELLINRANVISTTIGDEIAVQHINIMLPEAQQGERAQKLLPILREINQAGSPPLTTETVSRWNKWITEFVLIIDPNLERYPELRQIISESYKSAKYAKSPAARNRSRLNAFFGPALRSLARS
jgi:hypothetical protein